MILVDFAVTEYKDGQHEPIIKFAYYIDPKKYQLCVTGDIENIFPVGGKLRRLMHRACRESFETKRSIKFGAYGRQYQVLATTKSREGIKNGKR